MNNDICQCPMENAMDQVLIGGKCVLCGKWGTSELAGASGEDNKKAEVIEIWKAGNVPPQHRKVQEVKHDSQLIGEFLGWLQQSGFAICRWDEKKEEFNEIFKSRMDWLADYYGIDQTAFDLEKEALFESLRTKE